MTIARPTKAIIVAAGRGRRLMPYTDQMPKCLVPIAGRAILQWQLDAFRARGIRDIVLVRGYLGHVLQARASEFGPGLRFVDNPDFATNNILQSLFCAASEIAGPLLISYGDIVFTRDVVGAVLDAPGDICLTIDRDFADIYRGRTEHPLSEAEVADLDPAGRVVRVGKRALPPEKAWGEFIGLAKFSARGTSWLDQAWRELTERYRGREVEPFERAPAFRDAYLTDMLQYLIRSGRPITPVAIRGSWREIDTVQDLERARALLGSGMEAWK
ncbi:MAG: phosphocholine cytidylyltransferase family protein [Proteobacteria bacterium]|nr:phosphocholine cytidylyltransferase family protein [Pseudomonadota bacterium]